MQEKERAEDLMRLIRTGGECAIDVGARDGRFSKVLSEHFQIVYALDLEKPLISDPRIRCLKGNVINLDFGDKYFDFVLCTEVLEHIPPILLEKACSELCRVSNDFLLVGVPYKQDTRVGRTTCYYCKKVNPPWGHVNRFDRERLISLFPSFNAEIISFVAETNEGTNFISSFLMDLAGNRYGTYTQVEACIHCGKKLKYQPERNLIQKIITKIAFIILKIQKPFLRSHPEWIHILFKRSKQ